MKIYSHKTKLVQKQIFGPDVNIQSDIRIEVKNDSKVKLGK
jgi:hypothetical protein